MIRVGTSGWSYPHWKGRFYPRGLPLRRQLRYAAEHLGALEVNGTFYGSVHPRTFAHWRTEVADLAPAGFRFAVKGSRYVTHFLKLRGVAQALANFFATGPLLLGDTLGPILWQLPPQLGYDEARVDEFLSLLPRNAGEAQRFAAGHDARFDGRSTTDRGPHLAARSPLQYALEVRHPSFDDAGFFALCARHRVAVVAADTAKRHVALDVVTSRFAYARLHGSRRLYASRYRDDELRTWTGRIGAWQVAGADDVYVFFDNDARAFAPHDAQRLRALVREVSWETAHP